MNSTVTLCGSTRFIDKFNEANVELTKWGLSVFSISMALPKNTLGQEDEKQLKLLLDVVHMNKILKSDAIFVVGDGYIGESTTREIYWAEILGKIIIYQHKCSSYSEAASRIKYGDRT